jgi:hypothetical protein
MGLEAENGPPAPPARRARVDWYLSRRTPATAAAHSPPPRGNAPSGSPWAHFEWGIGGNCGSRALYAAAATASRLYWSRLELPTPLLTNPPEGADRPPARNSPRRTPQVARSAVAASSFAKAFSEIWPFQKTYGFVV